MDLLTSIQLQAANTCMRSSPVRQYFDVEYREFHCSQSSNVLLYGKSLDRLLLWVKTKVPDKHVDRVLRDKRRGRVSQFFGKGAFEQPPEGSFFRVVGRADHRIDPRNVQSELGYVVPRGVCN